mgnify:CR=1 FL=1
MLFFVIPAKGQAQLGSDTSSGNSALGRRNPGLFDSNKLMDTGFRRYDDFNAFRNNPTIAIR